MQTNPWNRLEVGEARRVDSVGRYDFFWIMLEGSKPGLILKLEGNQPLIEPLPKLRSLELRYRLIGDRQSFVVSLADNSLLELFEALCRNLVMSGEQAEIAEHALYLTVQRTRRWHYLLRGGSIGELSIEEQRGLVAEMAFLREFADAFGPAVASEAWKGPEGAAKDFELPHVCVEIKARRSAAKPHISISSVDQLADVGGARLFLRVTDVTSTMAPDGMTLHEHVNSTTSAMEVSVFALARVEELIFESGYDPLHDYDGRKWAIGETRDFEVGGDFPRITPPLVNGVSHLTYSIGLAECEAYGVAKPLFELIRGEYSE